MSKLDNSIETVSRAVQCDNEASDAIDYISQLSGELLDVCKRMLFHYTTQQAGLDESRRCAEAIDDARAVIAAAEGGGA